jgi:peptide/nickel transport system substrate-binding protein
MTIRMMAPQGRYINDYTVGQVIAGDLRKVGLNVTLANPMDWPSYLAYADEVGPTTDNVDVHMIGWAPSYLDATQQSSIMMPPLPPPGSDSSYYDGPKVTSLLKKANTELDATQRKQDYCTAEKQFWSDEPRHERQRPPERDGRDDLGEACVTMDRDGDRRWAAVAILPPRRAGR